MDRVGIDILADLLGDLAFAGQRQEERPVGIVEAVIENGFAHRVDERALELGFAPGLQRRLTRHECTAHQRLRRLPSIERIAVVAHQEREVFCGQVICQSHRGGKSA